MRGALALLLLVAATAQAEDVTFGASGYAKSFLSVVQFYDHPTIEAFDLQTTAEDLTRLRLRLRLDVGRYLTAEVHDELQLHVRSRLSELAPQSALTADASRLVDLDPLVDEGNFQLVNDIDRLSVRLGAGPADLTLGRQALSWGVARILSVVDRTSPFLPTDLDKEEKRGVDAVRVQVALGDVSGVEAAYLPRFDWDDASVAGRAFTSLGDVDLSLTGGKYGDTTLAGATLETTLWDAGVRVEAAALPSDDGWDRLVATAGADYQFVTGAGDVYLALEYRFERTSHYAELAATWTPHPLVKLEMSAIVNASDASALLVPTVRWSVREDVELCAGAFIGLGERPEADFTGGSELGQMPTVVHVQSKVWF